MSEIKNKKQKETAKEPVKPEEMNDWRHTINWELVYKCVCIFVVVLVPFFINDMLKFRKYCDENNLRYESFWTIGKAVVAAGFLTIYRNYICFKLFYGFVYNNINQKYQGLDREVRAKKVVKWCTDIVYYSATSIYCYVCFSSKSWYPLTLNKENWYDPNLFYMWPDQYTDDSSHFIHYLLVVQFGQHIYALLELIVVRRKLENKYYEWLLHHILAVTLIFYSFFNNYYIPGVIVLILHDVGDIFLAWFKVYGVFRTDTLFYINTFNMIISWFITRIYIYPKGLILPCIQYYRDNMAGNENIYAIHTKSSYIYMLVLDTILFAMHLYWFATMLTMLFQHLKQIVSSTKPVKFQNDFDFHKKPIDEKSKK